jgi:Tol biopolymer transport system component
MPSRRRWLAPLALLLLSAQPAAAQYFGQNKVQHRTFDFQVLPTEHFDIYYYPEEREAAVIASRLAERWYYRLSRFFGHELSGRQAVILYAVPAHFRQTNAVNEIIGEGTGGLTEAIKRRIVLPMSGSLADTDHVLGHELVHAFQFDLTGTDVREAGAGSPGILAYPLWFVEGMAEYLSLGPLDGQTAMWLRDAALRERLPAIKDLEDPKYFPYRWGHAFWAYIGATYGDRTVASLIRSAANPRDDLNGLARQLGTTPDALTNAWHQAILTSARALASTAPSLTSRPRLVVDHEREGGRFNVGPRLSPDGRQIAFFSSRDLFSIDLYLADAATGRIERKLLRTATDRHFDSLEFLSSAGAWSPDGRSLAVTATRDGRPVIALVDTRAGRIAKELALPGLDDALTPAFSPDGRSIVVSGNRGGLIDLYRLTIETGLLERLTSDPFADLEAVFTPDGQSLVFVTERYTTDLVALRPGALRLARLDLATRAVAPIAGFLEGKHLSPHVSADGATVTFVAEPDGVSNLYRMPIDGGPIVRLTAFATGIAGITSTSPAFSSAPSAGRLAVSVFQDDGHAIYLLDEPDVVSLVAPPATLAAAALPGRKTPPGDVERLLADPARGLPALGAEQPSTPYSGGLRLDLITPPSGSVEVTSFGTRVYGGIAASFSDMLGDRKMGVFAEIGGTLADLGAGFIYVNQRHRWNWALSVGQYSTRLIGQSRTRTGNQIALREDIERQIERGPSFAAIYPISRATRLELLASARMLSFMRDTTVLTFDAQSLDLVDRQQNRQSTNNPLYLAEGGFALVNDTAFMGATGPVYGGRSRIGLIQSGGTLQYATTIADWRRYFMPRRPITLAFRALTYGRYGRDAEDPRLLPLYIGHPDLVHGYGAGSISPLECQLIDSGFLGGAAELGDLGVQCSLIERLTGSRLAVVNAEVRAPLVGLFRGDLQYGRLPIDVAMFADSGIIWTEGDAPSFAGGSRRSLRSYGAAIRANVFGFAIVEIAASRPFDRSVGWQWQFSFRQGF